MNADPQLRFIQSETPAHGMVLSVVRMDLLISPQARHPSQACSRFSSQMVLDPDRLAVDCSNGGFVKSVDTFFLDYTDLSVGKCGDLIC